MLGLVGGASPPRVVDDGMFGYAAYYYGAHLQDEAFDVLQAGLFFGYMALVALGVALVAGAAGFLASLKFLAYIFAQIKFD